MGALSGYKVLDFSTLLPGPYATMTLADLGADVLKVSGKDLRADVAGPQAGVANAPLFLVISCDLNRYSRKNDHSKVMGAVDVGYVSQNICLACVALGLSTVPRAGMNQEVLRKELGIVEDQLLLINHPVGYKK